MDTVSIVLSIRNYTSNKSVVKIFKSRLSTVVGIIMRGAIHIQGGW